MRPIVLILVAVALGIAGLTAVLMNRLLSVPPAPSQISQPIAAPSTEDILVASGAIRPGTPVAAADLHYEAWPSAALESRFIRRGSGDDPKTGFVGTVARRPLAAGEPMTADAVFRQDEAGLLAAMLSPGMRAVAIPVTATSGVAGFILPHDHVDVLLNQDVNAAVGQGGSSHALAGGLARFSSEAVLTDLRVLAVDDKLTKQDGAPNMTGRTVTLEVTPKDAEVLLLAGKMGELTLALRSVAAGEYAAPSGSYTSDVEVSRALQAQFGGPATTPASMPSARMVRVNRGGATSSQSFAN